MTINSDEARRTIESLNAVGSPVERRVRPRAWTLQSTLDAHETTCRAHLWFSDPQNTAWAPLYDQAAVDHEFRRGFIDGQIDMRASPDPVPRWWHCDTHGRGKHRAWGCPECVRELRTERDGLMQTLRDEMDENLRLRELGGALPDENITAMTERLIRERNALRAQLAIAARGLKHCAGWNINDDKRNALMSVVLESEALLAPGPNVGAERAPTARDLAGALAADAVGAPFERLVRPLVPKRKGMMELNISVGQKALVTVDNWFYAPDGRQYRAVFGTVKAVRTAEESLGVKPNGRSTNWYVEIGRMTIAGCQVHYALQCDECTSEPAKDWTASPEHGLREYDRPNVIYHAD